MVIWYTDFDTVRVALGKSGPDGDYPISTRKNSNGYKLDLLSSGVSTYWFIENPSGVVVARQTCRDANNDGPFGYALGLHCDCIWNGKTLGANGVYVWGLKNNQATLSGTGCGAQKVVGPPTPMPPTSVPTAVPTSVPTAVPTAVPTSVPTAVPTSVPTAVPTAVPTSVPTAVPTSVPTAVPTAVPTSVPTAVPTSVPTAVPTAVPTSVPTAVPTSVPTAVPASVPTAVPTAVPTSVPTAVPTAVPMSVATAVPTGVPLTGIPTVPTAQPTGVPISYATLVPTNAPTNVTTTLSLAVTPTATKTATTTDVSDTPVPHTSAPATDDLTFSIDTADGSRETFVVKALLRNGQYYSWYVRAPTAAQVLTLVLPGVTQVSQVGVLQVLGVGNDDSWRLAAVHAAGRFQATVPLLNDGRAVAEVGMRASPALFYTVQQQCNEGDDSNAYVWLFWVVLSLCVCVVVVGLAAWSRAKSRNRAAKSVYTEQENSIHHELLGGPVGAYTGVESRVEECRVEESENMHPIL